MYGSYYGTGSNYAGGLALSRDGQKPETLRRVVVDLGAVQARSARIYDPWANRWSKASVKGGKVGLPAFSRSIVIRID